MLAVSDYRRTVALDRPFERAVPATPAERSALLGRVVEHLSAEDSRAINGLGITEVAADGDLIGLRRLVRSLLTVRGPKPLPDEVHLALDALLQAERFDHGEVRASDLPRLDETLATSRYAAASSAALWGGDITALDVDAIVNAANADLLGCFRPFHACIDNAIHSAAGPRLREDCGRIVALQGHSEPTGGAKATRGYNLPARFVVHTVGPIVTGPLLAEHRQALASSYRACLEVAAELPGVRSLAFCAVSTGVFGFPKVPAAQIATRTVAEWMNMHPGALDLVVFNVFSEEDQVVYERVLGGET